LIQSLLHHHYSASSVSVIKDAAALLLVGVHKFLRKIEMLDNHIPPTVMTTEAFVKLGDVFEVSGYASLLEKYLAFLHRTPAIMYLYGKLYLRKADYVNAKVNFDKAASGYVGNLPVPPYTGRPLIRSQDTVYADISAFYVHVADLFDNHKQDLYVIRYCKLALNAFNEMQKSTPEGHARSVQLWKRMFNRGLSSNAFEQAYWAAKSNPDQKIREEGLRCLIIDMIKKQEVESLHRMGFVGVRERIFEKTLESAIEDASLAGLHVAKIVHASYIQSGKYKQAAKVMYENAQRIGRNNTNSTNFFEMATEQAQSYLAAINSLELLTDRNAWFQINSDRVVEVSNPKRRKIDVSLPMEIDPSSARTDLVVIEEIRREYELIMAKLKLGKRIGAAAGPMNVKQVIATCTEYQEYETAATIAKAFNQDMTDIFRSITYKCMLISEFGTPQKDRSYDWIYSNQWASLLDGTEVTRAWGFLQYFIDEYDRIDQTEGRYRNAVLEVILTSKQNTKIPPWLSNFYKKYNPKDYVRLLLEHGYLLEAASFMIEYFAMAEDYPTSTPWMPYTTIDMILGAAKEYIEENGRSNEERDLIRNLIENLQNQLNRYLPNQEQ
ncbi:10184_t:CDS:2, partial [Paraglomus occultum]